MTTLRGDEVHPGDAIDYDGELHLITRVERRDGWAWPIACDDAGWAIALGRNLVVLRDPKPSRVAAPPPLLDASRAWDA